MEQCELIDIPPQVDETFVQSSFLQATEYLRSRAGYIWEKRNERVLLTWLVGTWSRFVQRSMIEKHGTVSEGCSSGCNSMEPASQGKEDVCFVWRFKGRWSWS